MSEIWSGIRTSISISKPVAFLYGLPNRTSGSWRVTVVFIKKELFTAFNTNVLGWLKLRQLSVLRLSYCFCLNFWFLYIATLLYGHSSSSMLQSSILSHGVFNCKINLLWLAMFLSLNNGYWDTHPWYIITINVWNFMFRFRCFWKWFGSQQFRVQLSVPNIWFFRFYFLYDSLYTKNSLG